MILIYRFSTLTISLITALVLSACQPKTPDSQSSVETKVTPDPIEVPAQIQTPIDEIKEIIMSHQAHKLLTDEAMIDEAMIDESMMTQNMRDYVKDISQMHSEMMIGMAYNDADTAFAKAMLGHHRGAIKIAELELRHSSDKQIRQFAQQIIGSQQPFIDTINKWLASHPDSAKPKPNTQAMQQAYADVIEPMYDMIADDITASGSEVALDTGLDRSADTRFARTMLALHIGGVEMARVQLNYGKDMQMRQLAQQIIITEQPQIKLIKQWLAGRSDDLTKATLAENEIAAKDNDEDKKIKNATN